ncbi:hypothetical protein [Hyalangium rubrum]|uniref:Uncharacterized protein n=1 Tax=Hyalangium rubrum TaxID=3103134 RepID=A0ABU5GUX4_9BACT|nr:hypothetical protein [Hyalangium sp. s54d21]MDY7224973.1 hypothetical protein [Hyalangium sp. s54d21]
MSTDQKGPRILARTFYTQLRASGYTPQQVIGIATELLDLVADDMKAGDKGEVTQVTPEQAAGWQPRV